MFTAFRRRVVTPDPPPLTRHHLHVKRFSRPTPPHRHQEQCYQHGTRNGPIRDAGGLWNGYG